MSNTTFGAWLQNAPAASLYLYSKAMAANPSDALAANKFSAFLIMGRLAGERRFAICCADNGMMKIEENRLSRVLSPCLI